MTVPEEVVLFDMPGAFGALGPKQFTHPRVKCVEGDIADAEALNNLVDTPGMSVFHLAGIMSGQGEKDFDLCMRVNFDGTRLLLDACRRRSQPGGPLVRFVFASSGATFGETQEMPVSDTTKQVPLNTYGMTKTMGEMLVNDCTRKGFVDGCSARLPTVIVRPGKPNAATTSCFSGVIREPLQGIDVALPVDRSLPHAVSSTRALVANLQALHNSFFGEVGQTPVDRAVCLPSISITLQTLLDGLYRVIAQEQHDRLGRVTDAIDPFLSGVVKNMSMKEVDHSRALALGLQEVPDVDTIIREYMEDHGEACVVKAAPKEPPLKRQRIASRRVVVVTGAGSGIGQAVAVKLSKDFNSIVLAGRRRDRLEASAVLVRKAAGDADVMVATCDVRKPAEVKRLFAQVVEQFGRCDLLFNNAGIGAPPALPQDVDFADWQRCIDTNLTGTFLCTQEAFKVMKSQTPRGGRIINNGSVAADAPRPQAIAYTAAKHAITGLTKSTALDGRAYDIACGQIDIGNARTEMSVPVGINALQATADGSEQRLAEPMMDVSNVANAVSYMASLPLDANVLSMTVMATKMPLVGRG